MSSEQKLINPKYPFPDYYSWPFFFTLQKHPETRRKQLLMWTELVLNFCKANKVWRLSKSIFYENLGKNPKINRKISLDSIEIIFDAMVQRKNAQFVSSKNKDEIFVLWKTIPEWEEFLYSSACVKQTIEKLETLDYISYDEDNASEEYYQMDRDLLIIILKNLEEKGKCNVSLLYNFLVTC